MRRLLVLFSIVWVVIANESVQAQTPVNLTAAPAPTSGQPGVTSVNVTGSGFPAGTILPAGTDVKLTPSGGGTAVTTKATSVTTIAGTTRRVTFLIPGGISVVNPTPYNVSVSGATSTGVAFASSNSSALTVNPAARIATLNPANGQAGQTVIVTITGQFTNFVQGSTQASFGAGTFVGTAGDGALGAVTVTSATTGTAQVRLASTATPGTRNVVVQTGVQQATRVDGFNVTPAVLPVLTSVTPNSGRQGQTNLSLAIVGQFTHFVQGMTTVAIGGSGATTNSVTVVDATHLNANISIAKDAVLNARNITVTTNSEVASIASSFTITPGIPAITSVDPPRGQQGQSLTLTVVGDFTNFGQGTTQIDLGPGITVGTANVVTPGLLSVQLVVLEAATLGTRNLSVLTGLNTLSVTNAFDVLGGPTIAASLDRAPNSAGWFKSPVTVTFTCVDAVVGINSCPAPITVVTDGSGQIITGSAINNVGIAVTTSVTVNLDQTPPLLSVVSPASGDVFAAAVTARGSATDLLSGVSTLTCKGVGTPLSGDSFSCDVGLVLGLNSVPVIATDVAGNSSTSTLDLRYIRVPKITITAPTNLSYLNITPTTVTGTVDDPTATVTVNSITATVLSGAFTLPLPLVEGPNLITATATSSAGATGTASIEVNLDTTPPRVTITSPPDQFETTETSVSVAGIVNDIVVGTVNDVQAQVTVNGTPAQVSNRTFLLSSVPLNVGPNVVQAVARDRVGNFISTQITVTRKVATQPLIRLISGNNQAAPISSVVPAPLVVALTTQSGTPVANKPVIFKVTQNDGLLSTGGTPAPSIVVTTNAQGQAQATWTLGGRAGAGGNSVEAYSVEFDGTALFTGTGTQGAAGKVVLDTGNDQIGVIGEPLPKPLIAVVVDTGNNRLSGVAVTFRVNGGGGNFAGQPTFTVMTDPDGRAAATLTLGMQEGNANNLVGVSFPNNPAPGISFTASGRAAGNPANTTISGIVLDNSNVPIPGVTIRAVATNILHSNLAAVQTAPSAQTNAEGHFTITSAPVGFVKLLVDGSTAQRPGQYPSLEYDMVTVAGQVNTVGMPIYLLPLNNANQLCVTATSGGGTLTIPEAPGFSLSFAPNQVTFPGGAKTGCVSVTTVHGDRVPMVPGFGQQPRFIVTIQPSGAVFNPPAAITLPNVDGLKSRAVTEMYSFDHDIGSFVAIGTGTVSDDGLLIRSNPGVGVLKAGWHCGGDPNANGTVADCPVCNWCQNDTCVADPAQEGKICVQVPQVPGLCRSGTCRLLKIKFQISESILPLYRRNFDVSSLLTADTFDRNRIKWTISKIDGVDGSIDQHGLLTFGTGAGIYKVRAESLDLSSVYDEFKLTVLDWVLGAHSSCGPGDSIDCGHAWVSVTDFSSSSTPVTLYGLWPDDHPDIMARKLNNGPGTDVRFNFEFLAWPTGVGKFNRYFFLTSNAKVQLLTYINIVHNWTLLNTCANFASEAVSAATGVSVSASDLILFGTPRAFGTSIGNLEATDPTGRLNPALGGRTNAGVQTSSFDGSPQKP